jgi:hypothetical protein
MPRMGFAALYPSCVEYLPNLSSVGARADAPASRARGVGAGTGDTRRWSAGQTLPRWRVGARRDACSLLRAFLEQGLYLPQYAIETFMAGR